MDLLGRLLCSDSDQRFVKRKQPIWQAPEIQSHQSRQQRSTLKSRKTTCRSLHDALRTDANILLFYRPASRNSEGMELTAHDLVYSSIPELIIGSSKTLSDSTHRLEFKAILVHWRNFETDVRHSSRNVDWGSHPAILAYAPLNEHAGSHHTFSEQLICGDESTVSSRFGQHVMHAMSSVFRTLSVPIWFGDYKICVNNKLGRKVPDIALVNGQGFLRAVGEVKTPWNHDLADTMYADQSEFRRYLGISFFLS